MSNEYDRWARLHDALEHDGELPPAEQAEYALLSDQPGAIAEQRLLDALQQFAAGGNDTTDRAAAERALLALRQQEPNNVVPLRPGATPAIDTLESSRSRWSTRVVAGAGAALAAAAVALLSMHAADTHEPLTAVDVEAAPAWALAFGSGDVELAADPQPLAGTLLEPGMRLQTRDGKACVRLPQLAVACLDQATVVLIPEPNGERYGLEVESGRVVVRVAPMPEGKHFSLSAGPLEARALGTFYVLEIEPTGSASVGVMEGRVRVVRHASSVVLSPRQRTVAGRSLSEPVTLDPARADTYRALLPAHASSDVAGVALHLKTEPAGASVELDGQVVGRSPLSLMTTPGKRNATLRLEGYQPMTRSFEIEPNERNSFQLFSLNRADAPPPTVTHGMKPTGRLVPAPSAADLLRAARGLVGKGRWAEAAASYRRLRQLHPGSAEAHTVLVALGQLQLDRLGDPRAASRSFSAYLAGGGALSQEAHYGKIRALRALGARPEERAAIEQYLARHPSGEDAPSLRKRLIRLQASKRGEAR